jgi:hypothetical protein
LTHLQHTLIFTLSTLQIYFTFVTLHLRCKQTYIRISVGTKTLPNLFQGYVPKIISAPCTWCAWPYNLPFPDEVTKIRTKTADFGYQCCLHKIQRKMQLGSWIRDAFLHLSRTTETVFLPTRKMKTAVFTSSLRCLLQRACVITWKDLNQQSEHFSH